MLRTRIAFLFSSAPLPAIIPCQQIKSVEKTGTTISSLTTVDGRTFEAKVRAGVPAAVQAPSDEIPVVLSAKCCHLFLPRSLWTAPTRATSLAWVA